MIAEDFRERLLAHFDEFRQTLATDVGDWVVKGFIYRNLDEYWQWRRRGL